MYLKLLKIIRMFHLIDKETYNKKRHIALIKNSFYFDEAYYRKLFSADTFMNISPVEHYLTIGWKEGANPSPYFSTQGYFEENPDVQVAGINPLLHYEISGKNEGRKIKATDNNNYAFTYWRRLQMDIATFFGRVWYRKKILNNKNARILVCLHLFYMEAWPVIKRYLENLSPYSYDLVVTYIDEHYNQDTLDKIKEFKPNVKFYEYPNQGFDIGPFIDVLQRINLKAYDIVFKIHSKGTRRKNIFIYHQIFKLTDWFYNLFDGILGGVSVHKGIDALFNNKDIGLVAAENLIIQDPKHKNFFTHQIAKKFNISIKDNYHYVAGTCFMCRAKSLIPIKNLNFTIQDFETVERGEFSFAHGMERIVCAMIEAKGKKFYGIPTFHHKYIKELYEAEKTSSLRLLDDERFKLDYDFFYKKLEHQKVYDYELKKMKIKDINRKWIDGKIYKIKETSAFAYLQGDVKRYENYCEINTQNTKFDMSPEKFEKLRLSMNANFDKKMVPVVNGESDVVQDGQHRLAILLNKYGEDYEVTCLKAYYKKRNIFKRLSFSKKMKDIFWIKEDLDVKKVKRLAIFASFSDNGKISEYVLFYLKCLSRVCDGIIFVADNPLYLKEADKLKKFTVCVLSARHGEYDFGSYKRGYNFALDHKLLDSAEQIIFCNDSCCGPIYPFETMFNCMNTRKVDFWGICANDDYRYHLQSYFLVFNKKVFLSQAFKEFLSSVKKEETRTNVILNYEVRFTSVLQNAGFTCESYIPFDLNLLECPYKFHHNQTSFPIFLMQQGCPLIKVKIVKNQDVDLDGYEATLDFIKKENPSLYSVLPLRQSVKERLRKPFFSIIMPSYNRGHCIKNAISSLLKQSYQDFELIIVDDGSTDGTARLIEQTYAKELKSRKIIYVLAAHKGAAAARNIGLAKAHGKWIGYLDTDNTVVKDFLKTYKQAIKRNPKSKVFYAQMHRLHQDKVIGHTWDEQEIFVKPYIDMGTFIHYKDCVKKYGGFDEKLSRLIDYEFILRLTRFYEPVFIEKVVLEYNDANNVSRITTTEDRSPALSYIQQKYKGYAEQIKRNNLTAKQIGKQKMNIPGLKLARLIHLISKDKYDEKRQIALIEASPLFDKKWYLSQYPDVKQRKMKAAKHYVKLGYKEGRNPSPYFDGKDYLKRYKDVAKSGQNPLVHYILHGAKEGRSYKPAVKGMVLEQYSLCDKIKSALTYPMRLKEEYVLLKTEIKLLKTAKRKNFRYTKTAKIIN